MALITPNYLQTKSYAAKRDRRVNQALALQEGIVHFGDFKVSQRGAGANMSVDVAAGESWVDGDSAVDQGFYHVVNDATVNVAIANNASGNPRIDTLVLKVNDSADAGSGTDIPALEIIQGTPTAAATLANLNGIAALSNTALRLGYILVANGAVKIENAQIGNLVAPRRGTTGWPAVTEPKAVTLAPAAYAHGRPLDYVPGCRYWHNAAQTPGANVAATFNTKIFDTEEIYSAAKFTCKTPGIYRLTGNAGFGAASNLIIFHSVGAIPIGVQGSGNFAYANVSADFYLGYGEQVYLAEDAGKEFKSAASYSPIFSMTWIGP